MEIKSHDILKLDFCEKIFLGIDIYNFMVYNYLKTKMKINFNLR